MCYRAGVVLQESHPANKDLQVEGVQLYTTYQKNGQWMFHNLGDMANKKKRDQLMAELSRRGGGGGTHARGEVYYPGEGVIMSRSCTKEVV